MLFRAWRRVVHLILLGIIIVIIFNSAWFLKIFYPFPYEKLITEYCQQYEVDPYLVLAVIRIESRFNDQAESRAGAKGLMQIMPETAVWIAGQMELPGNNAPLLSEDETLFWPEINLPLGIWYLSYLDKTFNGDIPRVLAAYNAGENKVRRWLSDGTWSGRVQDVGQIPYLETQQYIDRVLFDYQVYKRIYRKR